MSNPNDKFIHVTWSGGIDSTAVLGKLLEAGFTVFPVTLVFGDQGYREREAIARAMLFDYFSSKYPSQMMPVEYADGRFLNAFKVGGLHGAEIPRRNKHILDFVMTSFVIPQDGYYIGMGEYIGADTWLVKDHVGAHDADSRYLAAYLLNEYGFNYRFMALNDFGESRYKADRVRMLVDTVGRDLALQTSNCMFGTTHSHCGKCYKCVERHVAFEEVIGEGFDDTVYSHNPKLHPAYRAYLKQMSGELVNMPWSEVDV